MSVGFWMSRLSRYIVTVCTVTRHPSNQIVCVLLERNESDEVEYE